MRTFTVPTKPYDEERIYMHKNVTFEPGVTVLVGCNGSGKSTLMMMIQQKIKGEKENLCLKYDDRSSGGQQLMSAFNFYGNMNGLARMYMASEGERIHVGVEEFVSKLRMQIKKKNPKELWVLLDSVGSGLSIDGINEIKDFAQFLVEQNSGIDTYFVISTNEYEFAVNEDCIDVTTFQHKRFKSYEEYRAYILKTREKKDKRRAKYNGN